MCSPTRRTVGDRTVVLGGLLLLFVATAIIAPGMVFEGETLSARDLRNLHRPNRHLMLTLTEASQWPPQWNPYSSCGQPFAANPQHAVFHPLSWLFFVLPFEAAFRMQVVIAAVLSLGGMVFLMRSSGTGWPGSAMAGAAWALGGYSLSITNLLPVLFSVAALGWVAGFAVRTARHNTLPAAIGLAASLALMLAGGEPTTILASGLIVLVHFSSSLAQVSRRGLRMPLLRFGVASLLGVAMAAAVILPGWALSRRSARGAIPMVASGSDWAMPPQRVAELVVPLSGRLVDHQTRSKVWEDLYPRHRSPLVYSIYPGVLILVLAGVTAARNLRAARPHLVLGVLGLVLCLGEHTPIFAAVDLVAPAFGGMRFPEKWILLPAFSIVFLAGQGFDRLATDDTTRDRIGYRLAAGALVLGLGAAIIAGVTHPGVALFRTLAIEGGAQVILVAATFLLLRLARGKRGHLWPLPLLALVAVDLAFAGRPVVPTEPPEESQRVPPFIAPLAGMRPDFRLFNVALLRLRAEQRPVALGNFGLSPVINSRGIATVLDQSIDTTELLWTHEMTLRYAHVLNRRPELASLMLRRIGVRTVLKLAGPQAGDVEAAAGVSLVLESADEPLPLAYCVERVAPPDDAPLWLQAADADLLMATAVEPRHSPTRVPDRPAPCQVTHMRLAPGSIRIDIRAVGPQQSFVAINQTWDWGWQAELDGEPHPILRRDLALMGALVPAGDHTLTLEYGDRWVRRGGIVSCLTIALWLVALVIDLVRRLGHGSPP